MGAKSKINESFDIEEDHLDWLNRMATEHSLPDASKALRVLLDFAIEDGNAEDMFRTIRCRHCG